MNKHAFEKYHRTNTVKEVCNCTVKSPIVNQPSVRDTSSGQSLTAGFRSSQDLHIYERLWKVDPLTRYAARTTHLQGGRVYTVI